MEILTFITGFIAMGTSKLGLLGFALTSMMFVGILYLINKLRVNAKGVYNLVLIGLGVFFLFSFNIIVNDNGYTLNSIEGITQTFEMKVPYHIELIGENLTSISKNIL